MMRKKNLIVVALVLAAALALYAGWERSTLPPQEQVMHLQERARPAAKAAEPAVNAAWSQPVSTTATDTSAPLTTEGLADMYAQAENNLEFIRRIYADAQNGNAEAQFQLFSALDYCRLYSFYFVRRESRRTLDEALAWATQSPEMSVQEAREVHRRCQTLMENHANEFGAADDWLAAAAESGHPEAHLLRAERLLMASMLPLNEELRATKQDQDRLAEAKSTLLQAAERLDPSAVWKIGNLQNPDTGNEWVWHLAACKLGYDCSQTADWYRFMCRLDYNCQPHESGADLILRVTADSYPDLEFRADELVQRMRNGDLSDVDWR